MSSDSKSLCGPKRARLACQVVRHSDFSVDRESGKRSLVGPGSFRTTDDCSVFPPLLNAPRDEFFANPAGVFVQYMHQAGCVFSYEKKAKKQILLITSWPATVNGRKLSV